MDCMEGKYSADLGKAFTTCYESPKGTKPTRVRLCFNKVMKDEGVFVTDGDGQMTVDEIKFRAYADANSQKPIGRAMKKCFTITRPGAVFYDEAARATQCVFREVRENCDS